MSKNITTFLVPKMDCPSEEQMIRLTLSSFSISRFNFNIPDRKVIITHSEEPQIVLEKLIPLGFGAEIISNELSSSDNEDESSDAHQKKNTLDFTHFKWINVFYRGNHWLVR